MYCKNLAAFALSLLFMLASSVCAGQSKSLCIDGNNKFRGISHSRVEAVVEPGESGGFAAHVCQASLKWDKQSLVVASRAAEVDLDLFEVDLEGLGPVAAFQVKESAAQCCNTYRIYALNSVHLVRTLQGGTFRGADTDLDGRVEIWAEDRGSIYGLDDLVQTDIKYPPTLVLRFERGRLLDATSDFLTYFDDIIANIRGSIRPDDLKAFQQGDGRLPFSIEHLDTLRKLRATKVQVLEIVWAYLYSHREKKAWESLRAMWPEADVERIQSALVAARMRGILSQIDGESIPLPEKHSAVLFSSKGDVTEPQPIHMWRPLPSNPNSKAFSDQDEFLDLVIDSAGKVRSAKWTNRRVPDEELLSYAMVWKFVPALKHGKSVASRFRFDVSVKP